MAISPPGDIVLEVARAADPAAVAEAHARLASKTGGTNVAAFDAAEKAPGAARRSDKSAPPQAYVKFEGMVLQSFLQSMLPDDSEGVYGQGLSGEMWKSLLAQTLGEAMAERGGIGIASRLIGEHYVEDGSKVPVQGIGDGAEEARLGTQDLLSAALLHQIQRRAAETLDEAGRSAFDTTQRG